MRWSLANVLVFVLLIGVALGIYRIFWVPSKSFNMRPLSDYYISRLLFTIYLAALTTASYAAYASLPRWRRLWIGSALFGWIYLLLVLRGGFGFTPDVYASNLSRFSLLGILMSVVCALVAHLLPGLRDPRENERMHPPDDGP
jgi:hypothetical protein